MKEVWWPKLFFANMQEPQATGIVEERFVLREDQTHITVMYECRRISTFKSNLDFSSFPYDSGKLHIEVQFSWPALFAPLLMSTSSHIDFRVFQVMSQCPLNMVAMAPFFDPRAKSQTQHVSPVSNVVLTVEQNIDEQKYALLGKLYSGPTFCR